MELYLKVLTRMKNEKILYFLFIFLLVINILIVKAFPTNSSDYQTDIIVASGGDDINSTDYNTNTVVGIVTGTTNSTSYKLSLGFFYTSVIPPEVNYPPNDPSPLINTTSGTNETYQDLNCFATITDPDPSDKLNVTVKWYKNDSLELTLDYNNSYTNGSFFNSILSSGNTSLNDIWKCGIRLYDGKNYNNWQNSSNLTIIYEETPSEKPVGAGAGGAPTPSVTDFIVDTDLIKVSVKQGDTIRESIDVMNIGDVALDIDIELKDIRKFIAISENSFSLEPGKVKTVNLDIFARENEIPDAYIGRIIIQGDGITKIINVIIEVKERKPMFDILTKVSEKKLKPGDKVQADIRIVNMGDLEHIDVLLYYSIKNLEGKIITYREESLAIDKELSVVKTLEIPDDIQEGKYLFYSKVSYDDVIAASVDIFEVEKVELLAPKKPILINKKYLIIGISSIIAIILILFIIKIYKRIKPEIIYKRKEKQLKKQRKEENKLKKESIKSLDDYIKKISKRKKI